MARWEVVAVVVDGAVEGKEGLDEVRNIGVGRDDVGDGVDDVDALAVAVDGDRAAEDVAVGVAVLVRGEAAGDGVVGVERLGERGLEVVEEAGHGEGRRGIEEALLDVVGREKGGVPGGERDALAWPRRRLHRAPRHHLHR